MAYKLPENCPYSVTGVKTFRGMEGLGYNATVRLYGKKIGLAIDDACGGPLMLEVGKDDLRDMETYAKSLPPYEADRASGCPAMALTADLLVEELVSVAEQAKLREKNRKDFEKTCKTTFLFRVPGQARGNGWRTVPFSAGTPQRIREAMEKKYGQIVVLNDLIAKDPYAWEKF